MKNVFVLLVQLAGSFAFSDTHIINYGYDLCDIVTFTKSTKKECIDWVTNNSDRNIYSVALNVCVGFNNGPSSRSANCFFRASLWSENQEFRKQADRCEKENGNHLPRTECLNKLFFDKNNEVTKAVQGQGQSGTREGARQ